MDPRARHLSTWVSQPFAVEHLLLCYFYSWPYDFVRHQLVSEEPRAKVRKKESSPPTPSSVSTTSLKHAAAAGCLASPGRLGVISFRPHSSEEEEGRHRPSVPPLLIRGNICNANATSANRGQAVKRRANGFPLSQPVAVASTLPPQTNNISRRRRVGGGAANQTVDAVTTSACLGGADGDCGFTTVGDLLPECLSMIFQHLDVTSKGKAAQVCKIWRDVCYEKSVWKGVEAKLHLKKSNPTLYPSLVRRGIKKIQVLSLRRSLRELLNGIPNLEALNLSGCYNLTDSALDSAFCREMPSLKVLNLSLCKDVSDNSIGKIASRCRNLQSLDLAGCSRVSNNGLFYISLNMKKIQHLNLRSCRMISDQGMSHLAGKNNNITKGLQVLEELGLQDCQKITDEGLKHICDGLRSINKINLSFCVSVTDTGLKSLGKMQNLKELNLRSCDNISDIGIGFLAEEGGKQLTHLDTSFCANVTDTAAKYIANGIPELRSLAMANCSVSDEGLLNICKSLKKLETLNIGQCKQVTDKSLEVLAQELRNLKQIDLYGCAKVSEIALQKVRRMPNIADLNLQLYMN